MIFEAHTQSSKYNSKEKESISFPCWVTLHYVDIPHFLSIRVRWETLGFCSGLIVGRGTFLYSFVWTHGLIFPDIYTPSPWAVHNLVFDLLKNSCLSQRAQHFPHLHTQPTLPCHLRWRPAVLEDGSLSCLIRTAICISPIGYWCWEFFCVNGNLNKFFG